jgi:carbamoyl-phosphate synthase large subunit
VEPITIIITSVGGKVIPGIIDSLRKVDSCQLNIIGVDVSNEAIGKQLVDSFYTVPHGLNAEYPDRILEIAKIEDVDVIVPLSDEEALSLSSSRERFAENDVRIVCSDEKAVTQSSDKGEMLTFLEHNGVPVPEFRRPSTLGELDTAVRELGYPDREVVVKPAQARGSRGFWVLSEKHNSQDLVLHRRCMQTIPFDILRSMLKGRPTLPPLVAMEYLCGTDYNVDVLAEEGSIIYSIPIKRIEPDAGPVQVGEIVHNHDIDAMAEEITAAFSFDFNVNIELAYRDRYDEGVPLVYEINPRVSGPIAMHTEAGINMLLYGILMSLGEPVPRGKMYERTKVHRCWQEVYSR